MTAATKPKQSERLQRAAEIATARTEPWAVPLVVLLLSEKAHAEDLERSGSSWDRYPGTAIVLQIADGLIAEAQS